jgi:CheY-like chemotaxis protein
VAKLLIVDDDAGTLAWMTAALEGAGHEVKSILTGHAALEIAKSWRPDLILADILMPEMDGFAFARLVQIYGRVPLMFVSVMQKQAECILRGVAGYVQKPVTASELRTAVDRVLGGAAHSVKILIVDDDEAIRHCYKLVLEPRFVVLEANHGVEALGLLEHGDIALAIVDVHMPVMNGVELIRAMRADPRFAAVPVVVQTSDRAAARAPVWTDLHVEQTVMKDDFMDWLLAQIDEHIGAGPRGDGYPSISIA